jgi:hypothetical protein
MFELLMFSSGQRRVMEAEEAGIHRIVVDLETGDKPGRQVGFDTEISTQTLEDLAMVRGLTRLPIVCRINAVGPATAREVEAVTARGADEILVPMVRSASEVEHVLEVAAGRIGVGVIVETRDAVANAIDLATLPLTRMYVGLNDLQIDSGTRHIFVAVSDGTIDRVRASAGRIPFGFAGLTLPGGGTPLPVRHLIDEMARLACGFTFLRRSFFRDASGYNLREATQRILSAVDQATGRPAEQVEVDRRSALAAIQQVPDPPWTPCYPAVLPS